MEIVLVACVDRQMAIGRAGGLLFKLPGDMAHFKEVTAGKPVIMGRKTYESLPPKFRPLPGRLNIVLTQNPDWRPAEEGVVVVRDVDGALQAADGRGEVCVIGGGEIYGLFLPRATRLELTEVDAEVGEADVFFPSVEAKDWVETAATDAREGELAYRFVSYRRA